MPRLEFAEPIYNVQTPETVDWHDVWKIDDSATHTVRIEQAVVRRSLDPIRTDPVKVISASGDLCEEIGAMMSRGAPTDQIRPQGTLQYGCRCREPDEAAVTKLRRKERQEAGGGPALNEEQVEGIHSDYDRSSFVG